MGRFLTLGLVICLTMTGCRAEERPPVIILAAASTRDVLQNLAKSFQQATGLEVRVTTDDSTRLSAQIVEGAPAELFLSAHPSAVKPLKDNGLVAESRDLVGNRLVLLVPRDNTAGVQAPEDLPRVRRLALAGPKVPAGIYARQALTALKILALLKDDQIVSGENVRVTLAYVERGEVDAGIVYATDARLSKEAKAVYEFSTSLHDPVIYPLVLLSAGKSKEGARRFYEYLQSEPARTVFTEAGFEWLGK